MKTGDFEIHASKKIESFKYSYLHTLKVERRKKVRGLQKQSTKTRIETKPLIISSLCSWQFAKAVYKNKD
jgi:hypothetical protein